MQYRSIGRSDLVVPSIGFGCWELGGDYGAVDPDEALVAIHRAIDLGVTLFDTARVYGGGRSEELLARGLGPRRKDVLIVTKGGVQTRPGQMANHPAPEGIRDSRYRSIIVDCEESLRALGTDYVDLYLIHWPDVHVPFEESMRALNDLRAAGKARYIGVSNFSAAQLRECCRYAPLVANEVGYNLFDRRWEYEMMPTAREIGIGVIAYGPLAQGLLSGTFTAETRFEQVTWRGSTVWGGGLVYGQPLFEPENFFKNLAVVEHLKGLARQKGVTLPQLALTWVLSNPQVAVALAGTRRRSELEENVLAAEVRLTESDSRAIDAIMKGAAGQSTAIPT
jgi:aryl-alcohol dehydrogenase-like predicted oxidoreductase